MERMSKKARRRGAKGAPPRGGENQYVISSEDSRAFQGEVVAVLGFPKPGRYAKVVAHADGLEELKRDLRILGLLDSSEGRRDDVTVHVMPGLDVGCYVSVSKRRPQIERREV